jgi:hypothetical protein
VSEQLMLQATSILWTQSDTAATNRFPASIQSKERVWLIGSMD